MKVSIKSIVSKMSQSSTVNNKRFQNFLRPPSTQKIHDISELPTIPNSQKSPSSTNFLTVYFNFAFFLCSCPFRFVRDEHGWFSVRTLLPQKILCGLLNGLGVMLMLTNLRTLVVTASSSKNQNPLEYFSLLSGFFSTSFQVSTIKRFWANQDEYLHIVNFLRSERIILPRGKIKVIDMICELLLIDNNKGKGIV